MPWVVDDYRGPGGARPVRAFLDGLSVAARARVGAALTMLEAEGNRLRFPRSRSLGSGLHELRIAHPEGPFRIIYVYRPGQRIVLIHAFVKRTEQPPPETLRLARERFADVRREGGK
jgi:phage-related protein